MEFDEIKKQEIRASSGFQRSSLNTTATNKFNIRKFPKDTIYTDGLCTVNNVSNKKFEVYYSLYNLFSLWFNKLVFYLLKRLLKIINYIFYFTRTEALTIYSLFKLSIFKNLNLFNLYVSKCFSVVIFTLF